MFVNKLDINVAILRSSLAGIYNLVELWLLHGSGVGFWPVTPDLSILEHMCICRSYISVAIPGILGWERGLYDLRRPGYGC